MADKKFQHFIIVVPDLSNVILGETFAITFKNKADNLTLMEGINEPGNSFSALS